MICLSHHISTAIEETNVNEPKKLGIEAPRILVCSDIRQLWAICREFLQRLILPSS